MVLATAAALAGIAVAWGDHPIPALGFGGYTLLLGLLSDIDLAQRRLPNKIVGPLATMTVTWVAVAGLVDDDHGRIARAVLAGVIGSLALLVLSFVGQLGMGDVKLAFPIGVVAGWLGADAARVTVATTAVSGALVAGAVLLAGRGRAQTLPYGPFLALGSVAGILLAGLG